MTSPANNRREPGTRREPTWCPRPATGLLTRQTRAHNYATPSMLGVILNRRRQRSHQSLAMSWGDGRLSMPDTA
jgi:hypothetical protein